MSQVPFATDGVVTAVSGVDTFLPLQMHPPDVEEVMEAAGRRRGTTARRAARPSSRRARFHSRRETGEAASSSASVELLLGEACNGEYGLKNRQEQCPISSKKERKILPTRLATTHRRKFVLTWQSYICTCILLQYFLLT